MELAKPRRVHLMDELRGVLIIGVVLYHLLYDLAVLFPVGIPWMFSDWMNSVRNICAGALIVVSGISCHYTRSNWRRGLRAFGLGMLLTVVTALFIPSQLILFGILHFFGSMMMLYALLRPLLEKVPTMVGLLGSTLLFFLTWPIFSGFIRVLGVTVYLPEFLYNKPLLSPGLCLPGNRLRRLLPLNPLGVSVSGGELLWAVRPGRPPAGILLPEPSSPFGPDREPHHAYLSGSPAGDLWPAGPDFPLTR